MRVAIIGGGRWARTIASVLCGLPSRADTVVLHSKRHADAVAAWIAERGQGARMRAEAGWPDLGPSPTRPHAVIVVNRAAEHAAAALPGLQAGLPVLVEKPMAFPRREIVRLVESAEAGGAVLAGSNVVLFARYLERFAELVAGLGRPHGLVFTWTDALGETRRGEAKSYDGTLPVFDDVLPHMVPIAERLGFGELALAGLAVARGGAELVIEARSDGRPVTFRLARDADARARHLSIETDRGAAVLDFAEEPGRIRLGEASHDGDPLWAGAPGPLPAMLSQFLAAADGAPLDRRLSPERALAAAALADAVRARYVTHQGRWLEQRLGDPPDAAVLYALREIAGEVAPLEAIAQRWSAIGTVAALQTVLAASPLLAAAR
jgi:predicted dehydrogenase